MGHREIQRHTAAHRHTDHVRWASLQAPEQLGGIGRVDERAVRQRRFAVSAQVHADDAEVLGEGRRHVVPHVAVGDAGVQQQHRFTLAGLVVCELDPVDRLRAHGSAGCGAGGPCSGGIGGG
jgi:hypothetical protein